MGKACGNGRDYWKGRQVAVVGRLQNRSWEGQDGNTHYITEVIAEGLELLAQPSAQGTRQQPQKQPQQTEQTTPEGFMETTAEDDTEIPWEIDEDLPF